MSAQENAAKSIGVQFVPADRVRIGDIEGHISCVSVTWPEKARYEVTWWDCGSRKSDWFDEFELEAVASKGLRPTMENQGEAR